MHAGGEHVRQPGEIEAPDAHVAHSVADGHGRSAPTLEGEPVRDRVRGPGTKLTD